jgi:transaldolase
MELIAQMVTIYRNYDYQTKILVASVRHPLHFVDSCMLGADIATMPFKVIEQLIKHPLTDIGLTNFLKDWDKLKGKK